MIERKTVYIVGIGMDGRNTLTSEAMMAIRSAECVIGATRMLESVGLGEDVWTVATYDKEEIFNTIIETDANVFAVLMSGDTGFYSGAKGLIELIGCENDDIELKVIPGIATPVYFSSRIKIPWQDMKLLSAHGMDINVISNISRNKYTFMLLGGKISVSQIALKLIKYNMNNIKIYLGENLGQSNEKISSGTALEFMDYEEEKLTAIVIENTMFTRKPTAMVGLVDEEFIRGEVPMTKSEVRAIIASKLKIKKDDVCWDIGCGTGSVTVEMALSAYDGKVIAIDKNEEAIELTEKNTKKFKVDNVETYQGSIYDIFANNASVMKKPDKVFIGGGSEDIMLVIKKAYELNSEVNICFTAVSLETVAMGLEIFSMIGKEPDIKQISVVSTKKIGSHTMLSAANPIYIFSTK